MQGRRILVVEDDFSVASELADYFRGLGAEILGPVPSLKKAAQFVDRADGAILDINLNGETVFPLADQLTARGIPIVFFSGDHDTRLPDRFKYVPRLAKPTHSRIAIELLFPSSANSDLTFRDFLPKLRLVARLEIKDAEAADRLVERVLLAALDELSWRDHNEPTTQWLNELMDRVLQTQRQEILN